MNHLHVKPIYLPTKTLAHQAKSRQSCDGAGSRGSRPAAKKNGDGSTVPIFLSLAATEPDSLSAAGLHDLEHQAGQAFAEGFGGHDFGAFGEQSLIVEQFGKFFEQVVFTLGPVQFPHPA